MLAPKSQWALLKCQSPILIGIVKFLGSFNFWDIFLAIKALHEASTSICSSFFIFLCHFIISFKYLAYFEILFMSSNNGKLTLRDLNKLIKFIKSTSSLFYLSSYLIGNGIFVVLGFDIIGSDTGSTTFLIDLWCLACFSSVDS